MASKEQPSTEELAKVAAAKEVIQVKIYAPFRIYFEGEAYSLSAENATGPFDILPRHYNFLSMLVPCTIKLETAKGVKKVPINRGLMQVSANHVTVFVDV